MTYAAEACAVQQGVVAVVSLACGRPWPHEWEGPTSLRSGRDERSEGQETTVTTHYRDTYSSILQEYNEGDFCTFV